MTASLHVLQGSVPNTLCSPLIDPQNSTFLSIAFAIFSILIQVVAIISNIVMYSKLISEIRSSHKNVGAAKSKKTSDVPIFVQLVAITSSNLLCWIPSGIIHLISLFVKPYPMEMLIWVNIVVLPMNSIVNPIIFIITTIRKYRNWFCKNQAEQSAERKHKQERKLGLSNTVFCVVVVWSFMQ